MRRERPLSIMNRRQMLRLAGLGAGSLALGRGVARAQGPGSGTPQVAAPPTGTPNAGQIVDYRLDLAPMEVELGGRRVATWGYNGNLVGPEIRLREGTGLRVTVRNDLPEGTTVHWHGQPVPNAVDGVPDVTQPPIAPGETFVYEFVPPATGTYLYHSHVGLQLDRAVYGPLIVEPSRETLSYDREFVVMLDDWLDGIEGTPEQTFQNLRAGGSAMEGMEMDDTTGAATPAGMEDMEGMEGMPGMATPGAMTPPPPMPPDIIYPLYLINGRPPEAPEEFTVRRGDRVRLRLISPASGTIFRVALAGHRMTVTHTDGQPIEPVEVDVIRIGQGERYDVLIEADNPGIWQLAAQAEGTDLLARALFRYEGSTETPPPPDAMPAELERELLLLGMLRSATATPSLGGQPDQVVPVVLTGDEEQYIWMINDQVFADAGPIDVMRDGHIRFQFENRSEMPHPMHLHGHFFRVENGTGQGPLKDTLLVEPAQQVAIDWLADNPGDWAFHCHHSYHLEAGMMRVVRVG